MYRSRNFVDPDDDDDYPEIPIPGTTRIVNMPGRHNVFFAGDDDDDDDDAIREAVSAVTAESAAEEPVAATEKARSFFDSRTWQILRDWGVPAIVTIAGSFLGVPAPISASLGGLTKTALSGASTPTQVKKSFAETLVKTTGKAAPQMLQLLIDGTINLLEAGGKGVKGIAKGFVGGERELREIIRWYQQNQVLALQNRAAALEAIEQITAAAEDAVERSPKRRKLADTSVDNAVEIMDAISFWEKFVKQITEIWNKAYYEFRDGDKEQLNSGLLWGVEALLPQRGVNPWIDRYHDYAIKAVQILIDKTETYVNEKGLLGKLLTRSPIDVFRYAFDREVLATLRAAYNDNISASMGLSVNMPGREAGEVAKVKTEGREGAYTWTSNLWRKGKGRVTKGSKKKSTKTRRKTKTGAGRVLSLTNKQRKNLEFLNQLASYI